MKIPQDYEQIAEKGSVMDFQDIKKQVLDSSLQFNSINEFREVYPVVQSHTMVPFENLASLFEQVKYIETSKLSGDLVECGVWKGGSVGVMALANLKFGSFRRNLHLFDAFDDIPQPDPEKDGKRAIRDVVHFAGIDATILKGELKAVKGMYNSFGGHGTVEECKSLLVDKIKYNPEHVFFYKGWFQETLPLYAGQIAEIALLRLDGDWYESTKYCLEYLYDKVVPSGFVVIDDYGAYEGCKKAVDEFLYQRNIHKYLINASSLNGECYFFIK